MKQKKNRITHCLVCSGRSHFLFSKKILQKYTISYYQCNECKFIQTEQPYWLAEAYDSPINIEDTGIMQRNLLLLLQLTPFLLTLPKISKMLDFGGGYGFFTRLLRDVGFDAYWEDPYCKNLVARGFESDTSTKYDVITAFEVFEHIIDPKALVKELIGRAPVVVFSTQTSDNVVNLEDWWYMGYSHGQHVSIYSKQAIQHLAKQNNAFATSIGENLHVISRNELSQLQKILLHKYFAIFFPLVFLFRKSKTFSDHLKLRS